MTEKITLSIDQRSLKQSNFANIIQNPHKVFLPFFQYLCFLLLSRLQINFMKVLSLVLFGYLILLVHTSEPSCNVEHCDSCPDDPDVCKECSDGYQNRESGTCQLQYGARGHTTFSKTHTTTADQFSGSFLKITGDYILTHDLNTLAVLKVEHGTTVSVGKEEGFTSIVDSDIEIIEGEVWVVANDQGIMIKVLKVEGSQLVEKWVLPSVNDQPFNRVDLTFDGKLAMSYQNTPKAKIFSLDMVNLEFVELNEISTEGSISSLKKCTRQTKQLVYMTIKTQRTVQILSFSKDQGQQSYSQATNSSFKGIENLELSASINSCEVLYISSPFSVRVQNGEQKPTSFYWSTPCQKISSSEADLAVGKFDDAIKVLKYDYCFYWHEVKTFEGAYDGVAMGKNYLALQNKNGQLEIWDYRSEAITECICEDPSQYYNYYDSECQDCSSVITNCEICTRNADLILVCDICEPGFSPNFQGLCKYSYGLKFNMYVHSAMNVNSHNRAIEKFYSENEVMIALVKYEGVNLSFGEQEQNIENKFISDFSFHSVSSLLVAATYSKELLLFSLSDEGNLIPQNPIQTESQVLHVDFNAEGYLLAGFMNGDLILYTPESSGLLPANPIPHHGGRVEGLKLCNNRNILAIIEEGGFFSFKMYDSEGTLLQNLPQTELVKTHLSATDDCSSVVLSNTFLHQVQMLKKYGQSTYQKAFLPPQASPVGPASTNSDGDIIVFPQLGSTFSKVYKYNSCLMWFEFVTRIEASSGEPTFTTITHDSIYIGTDTGAIDISTYSFSADTCQNLDMEETLSYTSMDAVETATRSITHLHLSGDLLLATEKYSQTELYQITESGLQSLGDPFGEDIFTSDGDINAEHKCFVLTSHTKKAYIYKQVDGTFTLNHTIQMNSQVTSVDMSSIDCSVLLGHQDGSLSLHAPSDYDTPTMEVPNDGYSILQNKICSDGSVLAVMEKGGEFFLRHYDSEGSKLGDDYEFPQEKIEVSIDSTNNCQNVVAAGITMMQVLILNIGDDGSYFRSDTFYENSPISDVSINEDADLVLISRIANHASTVMYEYDDCTNQFRNELTFQSGNFDEANALNYRFAIQGNEDGSILCHEYFWSYTGNCPQFPGFDDFTSSNEGAREKTDGTKKLKSSVEQFTSENQFSVLFVIVIVAASVCAVLLFVVVIWKSKKANSQKHEVSETDKDIKSISH